MTNVNAAVSGGHRHLVSVADVSTKSHQMRLTIGLFRLNVDLMTKGDELRPTFRHQCNVLGWRNCRRYLHLTRHDVEPQILLVAESEL